MKVILNRQLLGIEDLLLGTGTAEQTRGGQQVQITKLDLTTIPWNPVTGQTIAEYIQQEVDIAQQAIIYVNVEAVDGLQANAVYDIPNNTITFTIPRGILSFSKTSGTGAPGTVDTYTLTLSDNATFDIQVYNGADGTSTGDMTKAEYDSNGNGKVDIAEVAEVAESVEWSAIQNKPTLAIGDMTKAEYDSNGDGKVDIAKVAESIDWANVQNTPVTYPPSTHTHDDRYFTETEVQTSLPVIGFNTTTPTTPTQIGQMAWNTADGTFEVYLGNGVMLQFGLENLIPVKNTTASIIPNGTICMATGSVGASGKITAAPMDGTVQSNADKILGMVTQDIAVDEFGFITTQGTVRGIDTSALTEGQPIYVSTTVIGGVTTTPPTTGMKLKVGQVIYSHATIGSIFFRATILDENLYVEKVLSTDKAVPRFNGTNGTLQNSLVIIDDSNNLILPSESTYYGDFTNADYSKRTGFKTSVLNSATAVECMPNGTGTGAFWMASNSSDLGNNGYVSIAATTTQAELRSSYRGSGSALPLRFFVGNTKQVDMPITGGFHVSNGLLGYTTGAGGTATQPTSKSTAFTLNKGSGRISMNAASLAAKATVSFTMNNTTVGPTDTLTVSIISGAADWTAYDVWGICQSGAILIAVYNRTDSALAEGLVLEFNVIKGAIS